MSNDELHRRAAAVIAVCEEEQAARHDPDAPVPAWVIKQLLLPNTVDPHPNAEGWASAAEDVEAAAEMLADDLAKANEGDLR